MDSHKVVAEARTSCHRCHKRKKKCDRSLPECGNCRSADVTCSFLDDNSQCGTYPVAFVHGLEARIQELEKQLRSAPDAPAERNSDLVGGQLLAAIAQGATPDGPSQTPTSGVSSSSGHGRTHSEAGRTPSISLPSELKILSLEATAERHLGPSSGLSFARLTQTILRRLTPDRIDVVFESYQSDLATVSVDQGAPLDIFNTTVPNCPNVWDWGPSLFGDVSLSDILEPPGSLVDLALPEKTRADQLSSFYFAHSHTLYPMISRVEFMALLDLIYEAPTDPLAQDPLSLFRVWMVLAIGSSSRSSISVTEESESILYYNKALEFFEAAFGYGDMVALEIIMLQVSFSFFNQLGPNTWFLVGVAARIAIGLGLHTATAYEGLPFDTANMRKRIFFSLYMMDRVVSIALGRPFALQDDDIEVEPFIAVDEEYINAEGVYGRDALEPCLMAVPRHILDLRRIASKITKQVYGNPVTIRANTPHREEILQSLHRELIDWRRGMPFPLPDTHPRVPHVSSNWYDFNYYTHLAMLYRPSPLFPTLGAAQVRTLADAAARSIRQAYGMHRQKRFAYNWLNLLAIYTSTLSLIYAATAQPQDLPSYLAQTQVIGDLELSLLLFAKLGAKFPGARNIQAIIERVLSRYREICGVET